VVSAHPEDRQFPAVRLVTRDALWDDGQGDAVKIPDAKARLAPVGRLDMDSRGLLILSEDGVLAKAVIGPASDLEKEYLVQVDGEITERKLGLLRHGLELDGRKLKPAKVTVIEPDRLRFILNEGRNRQIRRMCEALGLTVVDLFRLRIGPISLGDLPEGRWRPLTAAERTAILHG
jgi:23S rRNA pseudouridine2604 synthase